MADPPLADDVPLADDEKEESGDAKTPTRMPRRRQSAQKRKDLTSNSNETESDSNESDSDPDRQEVNYDQVASDAEEEIEKLEGTIQLKRRTLLRVLLAMVLVEREHSFDWEHRFAPFFSLIYQLASPLGLLGNLASIISLTDHWRAVAPPGPHHYIEDGTFPTLPDLWWVLMLNSFALALGCLANFFLYINAEMKVRQSLTVGVTICSYMVSVCLYMALLGATDIVYFEKPNIVRTSGFWQAVCASVLYFLASLTLSASVLYFHSGNWNQVMSKRQRRIMQFSLLYIGWMAIGGGAFHAGTMIDMSYMSSVFFCVITCFTIGYGDIVPKKALPKALSMPYLYVGLVLAGLVTVAIFQASIGHAKHEAVSARIEYERVHCRNKRVTEEDGYNEMRDIVHRSQLRSTLYRGFFTALWLATFWLIGALVLKYTEGWTYFNAFYFCGVSLATVGYGDFVPNTPGGRSFFLHYVFAAVPTMTVTVSDVGSVVMSLFASVRKRSRVIFSKEDSYLKKKRRIVMDRGERIRAAFADEDMPYLRSWHMILSISQEPDGTIFSFKVWHTVISALLGQEDLGPDFWLSDLSPIRIAGIDEKKFLLLASLHLVRLDEPRQASSTSGSTSTAANSFQGKV